MPASCTQPAIGTSRKSERTNNARNIAKIRQVKTICLGAISADGLSSGGLVGESVTFGWMIKWPGRKSRQWPLKVLGPECCKTQSARPVHISCAPLAPMNRKRAAAEHGG